MFPQRSPVTLKFGKFIIAGPGYNILSALLKEKFIYNEYYFSSSTKSPVIIDGGSSIGISVLYFKCLYPHSQLHCFEPYSKAFEYLEKNVIDNNLKNVYLNRVALSDVQQNISLFVPEPGNIINPTLNGPSNAADTESVEAVKLSFLY